jgi:formiminotetrahydrofolate cyclodeaminase
MEKLIVDGHPDLYRDAKSGAIVNKNSIEYENYIKTYRSRMSEKERLSSMESNLIDLKFEINEIKELLKKIVVN